MSLADWRINRLKEFKIHSLYYFSLKENIDLILEHGILPKNRVEELDLDYKSFAEKDVQVRRHKKSVKITNQDFCNLHDLVPVYLTPKTPTLYARRNFQNNIFFCIIKSFILGNQNFAFTDGNAGSMNTNFYYSLKKLGQIPWEVIRAERWNEFEDGKRKRNAEFLIHPKIPIGRIWRIAVNNNGLKNYINDKVNELGLNIEVSIDRHCFFDYDNNGSGYTASNDINTVDDDDLPF